MSFCLIIISMAYNVSKLVQFSSKKSWLNIWRRNTKLQIAQKTLNKYPGNCISTKEMIKLVNYSLLVLNYIYTVLQCVQLNILYWGRLKRISTKELKFTPKVSQQKNLAAFWVTHLRLEYYIITKMLVFLSATRLYFRNFPGECSIVIQIEPFSVCKNLYCDAKR